MESEKTIESQNSDSIVFCKELSIRLDLNFFVFTYDSFTGKHKTKNGISDTVKTGNL